VLLAAFMLVLFTSPGAAFAYGNSGSGVNLTWDTVNGWNYEPLAPVTVTVKDDLGAKGSATTTAGADGSYFVGPQDFSPHSSFDIKSGDRIVITIGAADQTQTTETITPNLTAFTSATKDAVYIKSNPDQSIQLDIDRSNNDGKATIYMQTDTQTVAYGECVYAADYNILPADYFSVSYTENNGNIVSAYPIAPYGMVGLTEDMVWGYYYQSETTATIDVYSGPTKLGSAQATTDSDGYFKTVNFSPKVDIKNGYTITISSGYEVNTFKANLKADVDFNAGTISGETARNSYIIARIWPPGSPNNYTDSTATADQNGYFSTKASPGLNDDIIVASIHPDGNITRVKVIYGTQTQATSQPIIYADQNSQVGALITMEENRPQSLTTTTASNEVTLKILTDGVRFSQSPQATYLGVRFDSLDATLSEDSKTAIWNVSDASTSTAGHIFFTGIYYDVDSGTAEGPVEVEVAGSSGVTTETVTNARIQAEKAVFEISGRVVDEQNKGIEGAKIHLFADGSPMVEIETSPDGKYGTELNAGTYKIVTTKLGYTASQFETDLASDIKDQYFVLKKTDIGLLKPEESGVQAYEQIENILAGLGYPDVSVVTTDDLTSAQELNKNLRCLFIDSSPLTFDATQTSVIKNFVNNGGSLYASDMSYLLVGQAFPGKITFGANRITTTQTIEAAIKDSGFADYLNPTEPATSLAVSFNEFMTPWIAIDSVASGADIFATGNIAAGNGVTLTDKPLAVGFKWGNGRVVYSSYFCSPDRSDEGGDGLLRYLVLNTLGVGGTGDGGNGGSGGSGSGGTGGSGGSGGSGASPGVNGRNDSDDTVKHVAIDGYPKNLMANQGKGYVSLNWSGVSDPGVTGYNIYRANSKPGVGVKLNDSPVTATFFRDERIEFNNIYYYWVTAANLGGDESDPSDIVKITTIAVLGDIAFADVPVNVWYKDYIVKLTAAGVIDGYGDGSFKPQNYVTRAEFCKLILASLGEKPLDSATFSFSDVSSHWAKGYIEKAKQLGIIDGYGDGTFKPDARVTRAEISKMICNAKGMSISNATSGFYDCNSCWADKYILSLKTSGILAGYGDGTFRPQNNVPHFHQSDDMLLCGNPSFELAMEVFMQQRLSLVMPQLSWLSLLLLPVTALSLLILLSPKPPAAMAQTGVATDTPTIVPIVFPLAGKCSFQDTFGAPRDGGKRGHEGTDIMADKMTPILAVVDGTVDWICDGTQTSTANGLPYYQLLLHGDDGNDYFYVHINNDNPGTDDGMGGPEHAYAPGIADGVRVTAGQFIAYVGDSGNAENTASHLHFELHLGGYKNPIDAYQSLVIAQGKSLFKDVEPTNWFFQYVNKLVSDGIIKGYADGRFRPDDLVTRAEFIKMVVVAAKIAPATTFAADFSDVGPECWAWPYVEAAKSAGIIDGDTGGRFRPDMPVNRAEAAKIIMKACALPENVAGTVFSDVARDFWGYMPIMTAMNSGIISGYPDRTFKPLKFTNRAEASKTVYMICK